VRLESCGWFRIISALLFCLLPILTAAQQAAATREVPDKFNLDRKTAARLRPELLAQSVAAAGSYPTGSQVFARLAGQVIRPRSMKYFWELRIVKDGDFNAFSSPEGTIYVESGLADLAADSAGLWAAILSHEIAHAVRRDWARRYLYEESLREGSGSVLVLGDPGLPSGAWTDSRSASADLARFCRQLEVEADLESLMLMARAGYHPDFVPALHHLLRAQSASRAGPSIFAMHPCWEERDRELDRAYIVASIEFEHRWPETYASPGGNPPTLVFADGPSVKKMGMKAWEIRVHALPESCRRRRGRPSDLRRDRGCTIKPGAGCVPRVRWRRAAAHRVHFAQDHGHFHRYPRLSEGDLGRSIRAGWPRRGAFACHRAKTALMLF